MTGHVRLAAKVLGIAEIPTMSRMTNSLSVLILSRGRPQILQETLASLISNCAMIGELIERGRLTIHVRVDDDDAETLEIIENWPLVAWHVGPRPMTIGDGFNELWKAQDADGHMVWSDDKIMETKGWDEIILKNMSQVALGYFTDKDHSRGAVTQFILPRLWSAQAGYVTPKWFPYWFIDTWWDHVAAMIGNKNALPISMRQHPDAPGTTGMKDLRFWARFFAQTEVDRIEVANKIRDAIYGLDPVRRAASLMQQEHWLSITRQGMVDEEKADAIERNKAFSSASSRYAAAKARAEEHLTCLGVTSLE